MNNVKVTIQGLFSVIRNKHHVSACYLVKNVKVTINNRFVFSCWDVHLLEEGLWSGSFKRRSFGRHLHHVIIFQITEQDCSFHRIKNNLHDFCIRSTGDMFVDLSTSL